MRCALPIADTTRIGTQRMSSSFLNWDFEWFVYVFPNAKVYDSFCMCILMYFNTLGYKVKIKGIN